MEVMELICDRKIVWVLGTRGGYSCKSPATNHGKTKTIDKTLSPRWNETYSIKLGTKHVEKILKGDPNYTTLDFVIFDEESRFFDVFRELEGHTWGEKIFPYVFCIVSHPQKPKTT